MTTSPIDRLRSKPTALRALALAATVAFSSAPLPAQDPWRPVDYVIQWAGYSFDTRSREYGCSKISCGWNTSGHLLRNGRAFVQGNGSFFVPPPPAGLSYIDVSMGETCGMGVLSDGSAVGFGLFHPVAFLLPPVAPPLPAGMRYERVCMPQHGVLLRSDGAVVAWGINGWGQTNVPALPAGVEVRDIRASRGRTGLLLSDGTLLLFGWNAYNQNDPPPLPAGMTYDDVALSADSEFTLALRSDGTIVGFGNNQYGQCIPPPLPAGIVYTHVAAGQGWGIASRSDDVLVTWGNPYEQPPTIPPGLSCVELAAGQSHAIARLSDGSLLSWGHNDFFEHFVPYRESIHQPVRRRYVDVNLGYAFTLLVTSDGQVVDFGYTNGTMQFPPLSAGMRYVRVAAGTTHALALRSDGEVFGTGIALAGQTNIPPLPPGTTYTDLTCSNGHSVLLRSDGEVLAFGTNNLGECNVPTLPSGLRYVEIECQPTRTLLLRSDGELFALGGTSPTFQAVPTPPPGRTFVDIVLAQNAGYAITSDGDAIGWGGFGTIPVLPAGTYYLDGAANTNSVILRRSDGVAVVGGNLSPAYIPTPPPLDPGTSVVQVSGFVNSLAQRVGPTSTYVRVVTGCAGSMPACELVPRDTPRIGTALPVQLLDLPANLAVLVTSLQPLTAPVSLQSLGMPGCTWHVALDGAVLVGGQDNYAKVELVIPDVPALVGTSFRQQALVLDPQAGNGFGAVVSGVAEGVIGR